MIFYVDKDTKDDENVNTMTISAPKSAIIRHARADDAQSSMPRAFTIHKTVLKLHSGYIFGEASKFIFCLASLSVLALALGGFWMSLKRLKR